MGKNGNRQYTIRFCHGTGCVSGKAIEARLTLEKMVAERGIEGVKIDFTGCHGFCQQGPVVIIEPEGIFYTHVSSGDIADIISSHLLNHKPVERLFYKDPYTGKSVSHYKDINFYNKQQRLVLRHCGHINPEKIDDYIEVGGYQSLHKVLTSMTPERVIEEIKRSGLRGRGGAGFSTGQKWEFCHNSVGDRKYMICNADEGDPGAFMDRSILEADPHEALEGMIIAAYAIGASEGYIYCRAEKPLAIERISTALKQAQERGFLGNHILGTRFNFQAHLMKGAGAFVCGEETALMASIEGNRGMPRPRPPFPAQAGLWGKPTNINNVKSLATVPLIIEKGADWYAAIGTEKSKGTVIFALTGKIANAGLVEVPMGTPLHKIIYEIGGGIPGAKRFKAVQTGGPSGGCLPVNYLNQSVDYESLTKAGSIMGSGGMVVMDEDTCMVDIARFFMSFIQSESCGKCVPCRMGTKQMLDILNRITHGEGKMEDLDLLVSLGEGIRSGSLCGLGQTSVNPVFTTLRYFRDEYEEHIKQHHCRAAVCRGLVTAPCSHICPAGIDVPRYLRFISDNKPSEALAVIREKIPFPAICGLVCFHPCETRCRRGQLDEPIAIRMLKRYAAEHDTGIWKSNSRIAPPSGKKVAVIGSGPAGLTAAYYLAKLGHSVTVFEALPEAGGMMRVGIPDYRLPKDILKAEIQEIEKIGVTVKTNSKIESLDKLTQEGFDAVFVAVGAHQGLKSGVPGEDNVHVIDSATFLRSLNLGQKMTLGDKVAVVGGGNVAIDAARSALRSGAKQVSIIYRRTQAEMPASREEIEEALAEGIDIYPLSNPLRITGRGEGLDLTCIRMQLGEWDSSGRRKPEPIQGSEFTLNFDTIIDAIGQRPDIPPEFGLSTGPGNTLKIDPETLATNRAGVFAGGDVVSGPASIIEAIATGRQAAISIDKFLGGKGIIEEKLAPPEGAIAPLEETGEKPRPVMPELSPKRRKTSFKQVELGYSTEKAVEEAKRCLRCDLEER
ncbi:MAG: hydrogenase, partial [Chloroflexi bacterium]|nr:hydrogenase [Chloroflexota bacterium]